MNALAVQLNEKMQKENPAIFNMLSDLGKNLYYPKGILSQSAEAGKKHIALMLLLGLLLKMESLCIFVIFKIN